MAMISYLEFLTLVPVWYVWLVAFGFGVIIGSFLNVVIYRLHTGKSMQGSSHCLSCRAQLRWYDLFPLVSYLALRGRCRRCGSYIPVRYFLVELLTAVVFVLMAGVATSWWQLLCLWLLTAIFVVITVYDLRHFIIPDELTLLATGAVVLLYVEQVWSGYGWAQVATDIGVALAGVAFFFALWWFSGGRALGFGDVKLAFPLGLLVGAPLVFSFVVGAFWIGAIVSVLLLTLQWWRGRGQPGLHKSYRQLTMKSAVPFAPFLIASCLLVYITKFNVLTLFSFQ